MSITDTVRAAFAAYLAQDAVAARPLYSEDFRFNSPQDDGPDRDFFFITCFPTASRLRRQDLLELAAVDPDGVFVLYEYELLAGGTYRKHRHSIAHFGRYLDRTEVNLFAYRPLCFAIDWARKYLDYGDYCTKSDAFFLVPIGTAGGITIVPKPHPKEFRDDVVAVARHGEAPVSKIAKDFGISDSYLRNWLHAADVEDGRRDGPTRAESAELRERTGGSGCSSRRTKSSAVRRPI